MKYKVGIHSLLCYIYSAGMVKVMAKNFVTSKALTEWNF